MVQISEEDKAVIDEEVQYFASLTDVVVNAKKEKYHKNIMTQILDLRESLSDANHDDIPGITEQIERLTAILNRPIELDDEFVNLKNPYFGHIRLQEGKVVRDFFIGSKVFISKSSDMKILDWKTSPIGIVYYRYDEEEEYEEEIGGRFVEGTVLVKRSLLIRDGELVRIQDRKRTLIKNENNEWEKIEYTPNHLHGGVGTSARAESLKSGNPFLGETDGGKLASKDKRLPEIAALIDKNQFDLITKPQSGVVAIQGVAGSGKTTIGLHRIAWLHYQNQKEFTPQNMMVMVFGKALANYITKVLPSLGVEGVNIEIFEEWATMQRSRLMGKLPLFYSENTPVSAILIKKHPALLQIIDEFIAEKEIQFNKKFDRLIKNKKEIDYPRNAFEGRPFITRLFEIAEWIEGKRKVDNKKYNGRGELTIILLRTIDEFINRNEQKVDTLIQYWDELFSDFKYLKEKFNELAIQDIHEDTIEDAIKWCRAQYVRRMEYSNDDFDNNDGNDEVTLDHEDDPILLLLYQKLIGDIRTKNKIPLKFKHIMIDEAQDLSPLELKLLFGLTREPKSVTLCGDVNQKVIQHNGFEDWPQVFDYLGMKGQEVSPLEVTYRSTHEIMEFALHVLGDMGKDISITTTRSGAPINLFQFSNRGELILRLANELKDLYRREPLANVAIICPDGDTAKNYYHLLEKLDILKLRLIEDQDFPFTPGIDLTDVKQVKGLEFDYVILLDVDTVNYTFEKADRYLLHIASTRAAHQLWIMNYRLPSVLIPDWLVDSSKNLLQ